jgi:hypothetical protein
VIPILLANWRLIAVTFLALTLIGLGIWFRGIISERDTLAKEREVMVQQLADSEKEVKRLNTVAQKDRELLESVEADKVKLAKELDAKIRELRKAKGLLNEATQKCLDITLPDDYLGRLPKA